MSGSLVDRAVMTVSGTPGTGAVTLLAALTGCLTFATAGLTNGAKFKYLLEEGTSKFEFGYGTYSTTGPSFTRDTVLASSAGGTTLETFTSAAVASATFLVEDLRSLSTGLTTLTDAATIVWPADYLLAQVTLGGNRTLALPTNLQSGSYALIAKQPASGGPWTLAYASGYKWAGGTAPTLSTAANAIDIVTFISDGTNMYGGTGLKAFA